MSTIRSINEPHTPTDEDIAAGKVKKPEAKHDDKHEDKHDTKHDDHRSRR